MRRARAWLRARGMRVRLPSTTTLAVMPSEVEVTKRRDDGLYSIIDDLAVDGAAFVHHALDGAAEVVVVDSQDGAHPL